MGNLADLTELFLYENQLRGEIPPELGNLADLTELFLYENQLRGGDTAGVGQPRRPDTAGPQL